MSKQKLMSTPAKVYSSVNSEDDEYPPLIPHSPMKNGHSHSHGNGNSHGHSHGKNSSCSSSARMISPRTSPTRGQQCGGLSKRKTSEHSNILTEEEQNAAARRTLWIVSVLCMLFMIGEVIGGFLANSLAIMTDAAHLLSDLAGFLISIFALWLATRAPTSRLSFGFHRAEILGALISVLLIWVLTGILVYEAIYRLKNPEEVDGKLMFIVAACGLGVNLVMGAVLHQSGHGHSHGLGGGHGHSHGGHAGGDDEHYHAADIDDEHDHGHAHAHKTAANINVNAAFIHVIGDALQSVGVMIAAGLIWYNPEWKIADPICTFLFSILVLFTTVRLVKQSVGVLMEGVPEGLDPELVETALHEVTGVIEVHDLHIWSLSVGKPSLSVHLLTRDDATHVLASANAMLVDRFNIHHSTIQVEKLHDQIECNTHYR